MRNITYEDDISLFCEKHDKFLWRLMPKKKKKQEYDDREKRPIVDEAMKIKSQEKKSLQEEMEAKVKNGKRAKEKQTCLAD